MNGTVYMRQGVNDRLVFWRWNQLPPDKEAALKEVEKEMLEAFPNVPPCELKPFLCHNGIAVVHKLRLDPLH